MVKGISRQVIVVHAPDKKLFEQAIFILKDDAAHTGITEEALMREAERAIQTNAGTGKKRKLWFYGAFWAAAGAFAASLVWLAAVILQ